MQLLRLTALASCILVLTAFGTGCDSGSNSQESDNEAGSAAAVENPVIGGTLVRHLESDCRTLNWVLYNTNYENYVLRLLYDNLLDYNEKFDVVPVLAESYSVSDDNREITILLREGLTWHDGHPITTEDVEFTMNKILDPTVPAVNKESWFSKLSKTENIDERTIKFIWKEAYAPAVHALTQFAPIPKHIYGEGDFLTHPANRAPIGSGAFTFEEWQTGQTISVVRNENYYARNAFLDRVVFKIIPDRTVALNALKTGEMDEMRVRQAQWDTQTNDRAFKSRFNKSFYYTPQYNYLAWNCRSVWFKDPRVRTAMSLLFDRPGVNEQIYSDFAKLVSGPFYINSWAYNNAIEPLPFDPTRAASLLDEAGWVDTDNDGVREKDGVKFEFDFNIASGNRVATQWAEILQQACAKVGINVRIRPLEGATYFEKVFKGEYDGAALAWILDNDPDLFDTFHSSQVPPKGLNHAFYSNQEVDRLLEEGRVEFNIEARARIYHEVHRLIHEDQPYTFVNAVPEKRPINKRVGNVVLSPAGPFNFYPGAIYWFIKDGEN